jgi:hypothetical protein
MDQVSFRESTIYSLGGMRTLRGWSATMATTSRYASASTTAVQQIECLLDPNLVGSYRPIARARRRRFLFRARYDMSVAMKSRKTPLHWIGTLAIGLSIGGCATKHDVAPAVLPTGPARPSAGRTTLVYVYRVKKTWGWSAPYPIRDSGSEMGRLRAGEYFSYETGAGEHAFSATTDGSAERRIELGRGQTYYLRVDEEAEFYATPPHLTVVGPAQGAPAIEQLTRVAASGQ